jgi:hypothetical protein
MEIYTCDKCNGVGRLPADVDGGTVTCPKCLGDKKLNWLERVFGKQLKQVSVDFSGVSTFSEVTANQSQYNEIINELSNNLSKEIDKQIMESFLKESNNIKRFELYYGAKVI